MSDSVSKEETLCLTVACCCMLQNLSEHPDQWLIKTLIPRHEIPSNIASDQGIHPWMRGSPTGPISMVSLVVLHHASLQNSIIECEVA